MSWLHGPAPAARRIGGRDGGGAGHGLVRALRTLRKFNGGGAQPRVRQLPQ